jgi:LysM repeat protein
MASLRPPSRVALARFAAPAAFLAGVTIAVLLVRAGLAGSDDTTATAITATAPTRTTTTRPATTRRTTTRRTTTAAGNARFYTVEAGDTFGTIAAEFGTTVEELIELNPDVDPRSLSIGQRIRVE